MGSLEVSSMGHAGQPDFNRSEGRAYLTADVVYQDIEQLRKDFSELCQKAEELNSGARRRIVLKAICNKEVAGEIMIDSQLPVEVMIPLDIVGNQAGEFLVLLAHNVHASPVPEWPSVYSYWKQPINTKTPLERVQALQDNFLQTNQLHEGDVDHLSQLWSAFGWTSDGVINFIQSYRDSDSIWFSGIRDKQTGFLVSACMGESLQFAGQLVVEGTEYGTLPGYEGRGLCSAAVAGLHAQILRSTLYRNKRVPLITAEFDMSSRSDVVGRHVGMTIPYVEGRQGLTEPLQVLKYNVSVLDRHDPNTINWRDLGVKKSLYRNSFRGPFRYWRNFIFGVLPLSAIEGLYSQSQVNQMLELMQESQS